MKIFFDRLRRWMIKKLGGYADFPPMIQRVIECKNIKPEKLQAQISVCSDAMNRSDKLKKYCEYEVMRIFERELIQADVIRWEKEESPFCPEIIVRATLFVVNTNDLIGRT